MIRRQNKIDVRLDDKELDLLNRNTARSGTSREAYLRMLIKNVQPKELPPVEYAEALRNLRQISHNMNQIAVKANSIGFIDTAKYWENVRWLQQAVGKMMEVMY